MRTELFWIPTSFPGRLAIAPRPRGGDWLGDEMAAWREAGIETVVSHLEPSEAAEFDLQNEPAECEVHGINYLSFPIPDRDAPKSQSEFRDLVVGIVENLAAGRGVTIHCRQGIGRAGMTATAVLVAAGLNVNEAVARIASVRGRSVPETPAQRRWLDEFARDFLTPAASVGREIQDERTP